MMRRLVAIVAKLTRLDTCGLVFISILLPVYFQTKNYLYALESSFPVLTICMAGFVLNDLSDLERDRENHPDRPLPAGAISEVGASFIYFALLAVSLITIKLNVDASHVYLYVLLIIGLINYNYVVLYVPAGKNIYVATVGLLPIFILGSLIEHERILVRVAPSLFLFLLGREILMDVEDAKGDASTFAKIVGIQRAENGAFVIKIVGTAALAFVTIDKLDVFLIATLFLLDFGFVWAWKFHLYRRVIIHAMKLQLLVGIYFLVKQTSGAAT